MSKKTVSLSAGAALLALGGLTASPSLFAAADLPQGYQVADAGEAKCGEAKCGEKSGEAKCGEAKCGEKAGEAKCGEAKCGEKKGS
ncbi:MAG: hypothetical protein Q8L99_03960 [Polycyclovorans sp.]|jgi:uncharacterized low-complexity protein|nr:low-complexity protein [Gammaproteobacteria bacterium]MDP1542285.1 hypothetical protein [Polycyclovorans sp.]|tara:strand:- start:28860 stop:29117 length:258 start_codon:yes stop_codon:yes gene_type:complete